MKKLRVLEHPAARRERRCFRRAVADSLAKRFKALADPARVAIVNRLAGAEDLCVCEFHRTWLSPTDGLASPEGAPRGRACRGRAQARHLGPLPPGARGGRAARVRARRGGGSLWRAGCRGCCSSASGTPAGRRWRRRCTSAAAARRARRARRRQNSVHPEVVEAMRELGVEVGDRRPKGSSRRTSSGPSSS